MMLGTFLSGGNYSNYRNQFGPLFGSNIFSDEAYRKMIIDLHPIVERVRDREILEN